MQYSAMLEPWDTKASRTKPHEATLIAIYFTPSTSPMRSLVTVFRPTIREQCPP